MSELPTVRPTLLPLFFGVKFLHELSVLFGIWLRLVIFNAFFLFTLQYFMSVFTPADSRSACYMPLCLSGSVNWKAHPKRMNEESVNPITRNEGQKPELISQSPYPSLRRKKNVDEDLWEGNYFQNFFRNELLANCLQKKKKTNNVEVTDISILIRLTVFRLNLVPAKPDSCSTSERYKCYIICHFQLVKSRPSERWGTTRSPGGSSFNAHVTILSLQFVSFLA